MCQVDLGSVLQSPHKPGPEALPQLPGVYAAQLHHLGAAGQVRAPCPRARGPGGRGPLACPGTLGHAGQPAEVRSVHVGL